MDDNPRAEEIVWMQVSDLAFDAKNPRLAECDVVADEAEMIKVLWDTMDVRELVLSIAASGYFKHEPVIVAKEDDQNVVIEGNRRLAAVDRIHGGIDGAALFEEVAAASAKCYLGERSKSIVFGAAAQDVAFDAKIEDLCRRIGEGDGFFNRDRGRRRQRDGKLDVVAWTPFSDRTPGKVLVFGQCKTGTHYRDHLAQLQPDAFCSKWFRSQPAVKPVRAFFVAEALPRSRWRDIAVDAGLLFDRCRIVDFVDGTNAQVLAKVQAWTAAAAATTEISAVSAT